MIGAENTPVNIPPGGRACYVVSVTPSGPFAPAELRFNYSGPNDGVRVRCPSTVTNNLASGNALNYNLEGAGRIQVNNN